MIHQANHLMLFDLEVGGHHASHIRHLFHYASRSSVRWLGKRDSAFHDAPAVVGVMRITLVVSPEFLKKHSDVVNLVLTTGANVEWVAISEAELTAYHASFGSLVRQAWVEWRLFCRYAKRLGANQALIMYLDRFQLPLALQLPAPCDLSGIYFRPTFHYDHFPSYQPSRGDRVRAWRQSLLWRLACRHPRLKVLFSLDPLAVEPLQRFGKTKIVHLPDPVERYQQETGSPTINKLRDELAIDSFRRIFLLFGALDERKGIYQLLDAIRHLPASELAALCVLLIGQVRVANEAQLQSQIASISNSLPVQLILHNQFVAEEEVPLYFEIADVVLAPYQRHVGMSGILMWAAALAS